MKETELQLAENVQVVEKQVIKQKKLVGSMSLKRGHKLYMMNSKTFKVSEVTDIKFKKSINLDGSVKKELIMEKDCYYLGALNYPNALKKFANMLVPTTNDSAEKTEA